MTPQRIPIGLSAALITPFAEDGGVDMGRLVDHARRVLERGCDGITLFGTTGEGYGLSPAEREAVLAALAAGGIDPARVHAAVTDATLDGAAAQARLALEAGVRGILVTPPFYLKGVEEDGLFDWFAALFGRIGAGLRGVLLYNIPGQTAVPITVSLLGRLRAAFPDAVAGVKDSSGDWASAEAFLAAHGDLAILVGDERLLARAMDAGASGTICGLGNIVPELLAPVVAGAGDDARVAAVTDLVVAHPIMPAVKALVAHRSGDPGYLAVRPPLVALPEEVRAALVAAFERIMADG